MRTSPGMCLFLLSLAETSKVYPTFLFDACYTFAIAINKLLNDAAGQVSRLGSGL